MWLLIKAIESEARIVSELEDILVQAWIYLSDKLRLTNLSWTNMAISHTCPERHICPEQNQIYFAVVNRKGLQTIQYYTIIQSQKTQGFCVPELVTLSDERRMVRKHFYCLNTDKRTLRSEI